MAVAVKSPLRLHYPGLHSQHNKPSSPPPAPIPGPPASLHARTTLAPGGGVMADEWETKPAQAHTDVVRWKDTLDFCFSFSFQGMCSFVAFFLRLSGAKQEKWESRENRVVSERERVSPPQHPHYRAPGRLFSHPRWHKTKTDKMSFSAASAHHSARDVLSP